MHARQIGSVGEPIFPSASGVPCARTTPRAPTAGTTFLRFGRLSGLQDTLDGATSGSQAKAQPGPYTRYLKAGSLKGKRFAVPAFILNGATPVFQGVCPNATPEQFNKAFHDATTPLKPETRAAFLRAVDEIRAAGATVLIDPTILPDSFAEEASHICTLPYLREGTDKYLADFGPAQYHFAAEYERVTGKQLPSVVIGGDKTGMMDVPHIQQATLESDPNAEANLFGPKRRLLAMYEGEMDRLQLDGYHYPAIQMPPVDETMPQDHRVSEGPHSDTGWINMLGLPAISIPAGFYDDGLPFGIEISTRYWHDGDLVSWAYDYEQRTRHRKAPALIEGGLLPSATSARTVAHTSRQRSHVLLSKSAELQVLLLNGAWQARTAP